MGALNRRQALLEQLGGKPGVLKEPTKLRPADPMQAVPEISLTKRGKSILGRVADEEKGETAPDPESGPGEPGPTPLPKLHKGFRR